MSRQTTAGAISALLIGLLVFAVGLSSTSLRASAIARLQNATATTTRTSTPTLTPCDDDPGNCAIYATEDAEDAMTDTADALTSTAEAAPSPGTATATPTATTTAAATTAAATTATTTAATTIAATAAATTLPGIGTPTPTPTLSPTNFPTVAVLAPAPVILTPVANPERFVPTETPTPIPADALTCFPGQPLVLTGSGPARSAFLVYFAQRIVTGGSVSSTGRFATTLVVGNERAGVYSITVRVRGTAQVLLDTRCVVPNVPPTLIPRARALP